MEKEKIFIDFEVHKEIEKRRTSFTDEPNNVLRRIFNLPETSPDIEVDDMEIKPADFIRRGIKPGLYTKGILLPNGMKLHNQSRGRKFEAEIKSGKIVYNGKIYNSLSKAACVATDVSTNGWIFWHYFDKDKNKWIPCSNLRSR
jgi:hypothetical protein